MEILIKIKENKEIQLNLILAKKIIDSLKWIDDNNLSRLLLSKIDQILKKNKIGLDKI